MPYLQRYTIQENDVWTNVEITEEQAEEYRKFQAGDIDEPEWVEDIDWDDGDSEWRPANEVEVSVGVVEE
jgi:hypothetical protein|tara:strand:- start:616 stop:825 length:210 start_codon:yes stop_codon:yes gene_type:complete